MPTAILRRVSLVAGVTAASIACAWLYSQAIPKRYAATARLLVTDKPLEAAAPLVSRAALHDISVSSQGGSRMLSIQHVSSDPRRAAAVVNDFVAANADAKAGLVIVDRAAVPYQPVGPGLATNLGLGALAGLLLGFSLVALRARRERPAPPRMEPTAQPASAKTVVGGDRAAYQTLSSELLESWFPEHRMLAVSGNCTREQQANVAARLAVSFAERGEKTLLVDASSQSQEVQLKPVSGVEHLHLLLAPRERLTAALTEAARRFRVVLIDLPAEPEPRRIFAGLAGGALLVASSDPAEAAALQALESELARVPARVVGTVVGSG